MAGFHAETVEFLVADLGRLSGRTVLMDYFGILPRDLAFLLTRPADAVFLLPTPAFRAAALGTRYTDPARARANWGDVDHGAALARRLERDAAWDAEVRRQASGLGLFVVEVDGTRSPDDVADEVGCPVRSDL